MASLFTLPAGRRAKWVVALIWLAAIFASFATNLPAKFSDAEKNESTSFLPGDAESTKALEVSNDLQDGEKAAIVIVYRREGGLTAADKQRIAQDIEALNGLELRATSPLQQGGAVAPTAAARSCRRRSRATARPTRSSIPSTRCASASATRAAAWR